LVGRGCCDAPNKLLRKRVVVRAPASIANLGPGFDVLAVSLEGLYDVVEVSLSPGSGRICVESRGFDVPSGEGNVAYHVAKRFAEEFPTNAYDIHISVSKGVPPASGLGSSGATSAATAYALNVLFGAGMGEGELLKLAGAGEAFAAGTPHYDNVAASLFGGFVILDLEGGRVLRHTPRRRIPIAVVTPRVGGLQGVKKTEHARSLLPKQVSLESHVKQSSSLAKLIYGILTEDVRVIGEAVSTDYIVEPCRAKMIPFYDEIKRLALSEGAYGFNICGAGPSVFLLHEDAAAAGRIAERIKEYLAERGVEAYSFVSSVSSRGVEVLEVVR
jgi:homoserine kinase